MRIKLLNSHVYIHFTFQFTGLECSNQSTEIGNLLCQDEQASKANTFTFDMSLLSSDISMTSNFINIDQEEPHQQVKQQQYKHHHKPEHKQSEGTHQNKEQIDFFIEPLPEKVHTFLKVVKTTTAFFQTQPNHNSYGKMDKLRVKNISKVHLC